MARSIRKKTQPGEPPDGGWGWLIVAGYGVSQLIGVGLNRSFSIIYQQLIIRYGQSATATSWVLSIFSCTKFASSPIVAMLCNRYGQREVGIAAGIIACASMVASAYAPSLTYLYFVFGLTLAFARNMQILSGISAIGLYFKEKRATANSLALMSNSIGGVVMAPVVQFLIHEYGYSGCMLIGGGLTLNFCVSAALYRPLKKQKICDRNNATIEAEEERSSFTEDVELQEFKTNNMDGPSSGPDSASTQSVSTTVRPVRKKKFLKRASQACSSNFDLPLLKHTPFVAYALLNCTVLMMNVMNTSFLASLGKDKGFSVTEITYTIVATNLTGAPVRAITGFIMDSKWFRPRRITIIGWMVLVVGILTFCLPLVPGVVSTIVVWCLYEAVIGACECQQATFVADIVGRERLTSGMGLLRMFAGFSGLSGPVVGGLLRDITGEYAYAYFVGGVSTMTAAILYLMYRYANIIFHCRKPRTTRLD